MKTIARFTSLCVVLLVAASLLLPASAQGRERDQNRRSLPVDRRGGRSRP